MFTYTVSDGNGGTDGATVFITVRGVSADSLALVALYEATGGPSWANDENWLAGPVGTWHGVSVNAEGRVFRLQLVSNNLNGTLPSEIGALTSLRELRLPQNQLMGEIPAEITQLTELRVIQLNNNGLEEFPEGIDALENLEQLTLFENDLLGPIPAAIGNLTQLTSLGLGQNDLNGEIPEEIGQLTNLVAIDVNGNDLEGGLPAAMGDLASLQSLVVNNNLLAGPIPLTFVGLTALNTFNLAGTELCVPDDPALQAWLGGVANVIGDVVACPTNQPPMVAAPIDNTNLAPGAEYGPFDLTEVFSDGNGVETLSFTCGSADEAVAALEDDCSDGTLTVTAGTGPGEAEITVTATDDAVQSVADDFTVTVQDVPPEVEDPIEDLQLALGGTPFEADLAEVFSDGNGVETLSFTCGSADEAVAALEDDCSDGTLTVTAAAVGQTTITVSASDGVNTTAVDTFAVSVVDENVPPTVPNSLTDQTLLVNGAPFVAALDTVFADGNGIETLTFAVGSVEPGGVVSAVVEGGVLTVTAVSMGEAEVTVTATDDAEQFAQSAFTVTSQDVPPEVEDPIEDQELVVNGTPFEADLAAVFSDSNGVETLSFEIVAETDPDNAITVALDGSALLVTGVGVGTAEVRVSANDGVNERVEDAFTVTVVNEDVPPEVESPIADQELALGGVYGPVALAGVFSDGNGVETLSFTCGSADASIAALEDDCADGTLTISATAAGATSVTVSASDGVNTPVENAFTVTVVDEAVSVVSVTAMPSAPSIGEAVSVTAIVTGTPSVVTLYYRTGGTSSFQSTAMAGSGESRTATIPGSAITSRGVEYRVDAETRGGVPIQGPLFALPVRIAGSGLSSPSLPGSNVANGYRMVSVPLDLDDASASTVLDEFGPYDDEEWRFFRLLPPGQQGDEPAADADDQWYKEGPASVTMEPGEAFLMITREGRAYDTGSGTTLPTDAAYEVDLHARWNFVASPFDFSVPVSRTRLASGEPVRLQAYDGTWRNLSDGDSMVPFSGYALRVQSEDVLVIEPGADTGGRAQREGGAKEAEAEEHGEGWAIRIDAASGQARDENNVAVVSPTAETGHDPLDWYEPPIVGNYVSVSFDPAAGQAVPLTVDARPIPEEGVVWPLSVRTNVAGSTTLSFHDVTDIPPEFEVWLVDEVGGGAKDLRRNAWHAFASHGNGHRSRFQLIVGTPEFVRSQSGLDGTIPLEYGLAQNFPNPFNDVTSIQYQLPESQRVVLEVFDVVGRLVATLVDQEKEAGYHEAQWMGQDGLASGVYICRLRAGSFVETRRIVLLK